MSIDGVSPGRPANVLQIEIAQIDEADIHLVSHLFKGRRGNTDSAGFGDAFQPRCDIDAVPKDVIGINDDIANIDSDPVL